MAQWNVITAFVLDQLFGYQSANKLRENPLAIVSAGLGRYMGGSRDIPNNPGINLFGGPLKSKQNGVGPYDVYDYVDIEIDGTNQTGITFRARVECRTDRAGCTITPKIRNITTSTDMVTGAACAAGAVDFSGTNQKQTLTFTPTTGANKYRLMFTLSSPSGSTWMIGELERIATS